MEETTEFQDWEVLHSSEAGLTVSAVPASTDHAFEGIESDSDGAIKSDYFALDSEKSYARRTAPSDDDDDREEESPPDSDNPSWVDPNSDSRYLGEPSKRELGFAGIEFPQEDPGGFWTSDESSDGQESQPPDGQKGEVGCGESSKLEVGVEGVDVNGGEGERKEVGFGGIGEADGVGAESENSDVLGSGDAPEMRDVPESSEERGGGENGNLENISVDEGEKAGTVWWKLPFELLKFCVFRIRPVWSISIAAAVVGFVMLGRRLYKMKHKSRSIPVKVSVDDKKATHQFMVRAARLNEAFSVVKRVPIIRSSLPAAGVTPWPAMALR